MNNKNYVWVKAIICPKCSQMLYSRYRHDYRSCQCGEVAIDGGLDYLRIIFNDKPPKVVRKLVRATKEQLYKDWNYGEDKFGIIIPLTSPPKRSRVGTQ